MVQLNTDTHATPCHRWHASVRLKDEECSSLCQYTCFTVVPLEPSNYFTQMFPPESNLYLLPLVRNICSCSSLGTCIYIAARCFHWHHNNTVPTLLGVLKRKRLEDVGKVVFIMICSFPFVMCNVFLCYNLSVSFNKSNQWFTCFDSCYLS